MKPSVTKLIQLLDKPALMSWANKIGLQGIKLEDYRKSSLSKGASMHMQIESYLKDGTEFANLDLGNNFKKFFTDKEIICFEKNIETEWFIGRLDIKFKYNNLLYLSDFKSNHTVNYFENKLQLCAYRMAEECDKIATISIPDFSIIEINITNYKPYQDIIINLSNIYNLKSQL